MNEIRMHEARAVWLCRREEEGNQFAGFHTRLSLAEETHVTMRIAARSYYRLFLNGEMAASGPARTAERYCRVDELELALPAECDIAIEVAAYAKPGKYCNDCTMEPGLLAVEVEDENGTILTATGGGDWTCQELTYRRATVETMSHCRGIVEYYDLSKDSFAWRRMELPERPVLLDEEVTYLKRRAPYATYRRIPMQSARMIYDVVCRGNAAGNEKNAENGTAAENGAGAGNGKNAGNGANVGAGAANQDVVIFLARLVNAAWYGRIPQENLFLEDLKNEADAPFSGEYGAGRVSCVTPGKNPAAIVWELPESEVGFLDFEVTITRTCILDVVNSDALSASGHLEGNTYAARYVLQPGSYHLTSFEPKLVRYVKCILRTDGLVKLQTPAVLEDTYPDGGEAYFACDDGDLNRIYQAARRTLRLNTLDIFMDCPERERGGWLCDSYFLARGAWQMFGDLSVEKDFLENFMLTNPNEMWNAFFPEVYPGAHGTPRDVGIRNWSFWLMLEFCDYYERSGDEGFVEACRARVERFVEGVLSFRGASGLLENMGTVFVDWSLSNKAFAQKPISIPVNCQAVCMLEGLAKLYGRSEWREAADEMRTVIEGMDGGGFLSAGGDCAGAESMSKLPDGADALESAGGADVGKSADGASAERDLANHVSLKRGDCQTESGVALEIWSGFHENDKAYLRRFVETMGSCPKYRSDPNVGKANLFIGLMLRFDVLARMGKIDTLLREWKDLYLEELRIGPGTLFESISERTGCHGFNGYVGALMTNTVLGLGMPMQRTKTVRISPHPGDLNWAGGSVKCADGTIFLRWSADHEEHVLEMFLHLPKGWTARYEMPFELAGWTILSMEADGIKEIRQ